MKFEFSHPIPADPDAVAAALLDRDFQSSLHRVGKLKERELLGQEEHPDGSVTRRLRCVLDLDVSGVAKKFIGDSDPAWVQHETWDPQARAWAWEVHPEVGEGLLAARGSILLEGSEGKTIRTVTGEVKVGVPLYGGKVEGWIVEGLEQAYGEEAELITRWLQRA